MSAYRNKDYQENTVTSSINPNSWAAALSRNVTNKVRLLILQCNINTHW